MPQGSEKSVVSQGSLVVDGRYEAITVENTVNFHETEYDEFSGYNIPTSLTTEWTGQTADGQPISIVMNLKLNNLLDKIDILSELPYIIRVFVQTFITAPYVYQWLEDSTISIKIGESDLVQVRGSAFHESSFMGDY